MGSRGFLTVTCAMTGLCMFKCFNCFVTFTLSAWSFLT